jgi:hypothetical protein
MDGIRSNTKNEIICEQISVSMTFKENFYQDIPEIYLYTGR